MDKELIERLAKEAGIDVKSDTLCRYEGWREPMEKFAALVAEECAKLVSNTYEGSCNSQDGESGYDFFGENSSEAIRAMFLMRKKE